MRTCIINDGSINIRITSIQRIVNDMWRRSWRWRQVEKCERTRIGPSAFALCHALHAAAATSKHPSWYRVLGACKQWAHTRPDPIVIRSHALPAHLNRMRQLKLIWMTKWKIGYSKHRIRWRWMRSFILLLLPRVLIKHQPIFAYEPDEHSFEHRFIANCVFFSRRVAVLAHLHHNESFDIHHETTNHICHAFCP